MRHTKMGTRFVLGLCLVGYCLSQSVSDVDYGGTFTPASQDPGNIGDPDVGSSSVGTRVKVMSLGSTAPQPQVPKCRLTTSDSDMHAKVQEIQDGGTELLRYRILFPEYEVSPLESNSSRHYKASRWERVFSPHGETLLSLAFNYDILSLNLLTFGERNIDVSLVDTPDRCYGMLPMEERVEILRDLLIKDFKISEIDDNEESWLPDGQYVCHQVIRDGGNGYAEFVHKCCTREKGMTDVRCREDVKDRIINSLYILMSLLRLVALLFGPLLLLKLFYRESIQKTRYVVPLKERVSKTLLLKKVRTEDDGLQSRSRQNKEMKQFRTFRNLVKNISADEIVPISFKKLDVLVDHQELISEKNTPVGVFRFLYETLFRCSLTRHEPFASCCVESIFGSWSKRFLCFKLLDGSDCNRSCKKFCSWGHIFRFVGGLALLALIPLPYIIRVIIYYKYEQEETEARKDAVDNLGLHFSMDHGLFLYLTPAHGGLIAMYVLYIASFTLLAAFRMVDGAKFDKIVRGSIEDMRNVSYLQSVRMLFAHLLLPFEKFGILCGLIVAALYWPFALPFCLLTALFYCLPTFYLSGRLLISKRPQFLRSKPLSTPASHIVSGNTSLLSKGVTSFETFLLLDNISPETHLRPVSPYSSKSSSRRVSYCDKGYACSILVSLIVGLLCIINLYCLLFMYAEVVGVLAEVAVLSMMGTVVNASSAAKYVMLAFWVVLYTTSCYNNAYSKYEKLNRKLFAYIKDKLGEDIEAVTMLPEVEQHNTAFKYFSLIELREYVEKIKSISLVGSNCGQCSVSRPEFFIEDVVADKHGRLFWDIKSLIMFVDTKDVPRIPKKLFFDVCKQDIPGCPGPVYKSMISATKKLFLMVIFMTFVFIVVLAFGNIYDISNTNQLLLTLASGFLPFVIRFVIAPKEEELELNTYSFHGKIHQLIFTYTQSWPVYDLDFERDETQARDQGAHGGASATTVLSAPTALMHRQMIACETPGPNPPDIVDPTHVDLLITVRDDESDDNIRSEPGSMGSNRSINSGGHHGDDHHHHGSAHSASALNNPTNAQLQQVARAGLAQSQDQVGLRGEPSCHSSLRSQAGSPVSTPAAMMSPVIEPAAPAHASPLVHQPAAAEGSSSRPQTPKTVDLVVDLTKGGVHVRGAEAPDRSESSTNGIPLWPLNPSYKQLGDKDSEAQL